MPHVELVQAAWLSIPDGEIARNVLHGVQELGTVLKAKKVREVKAALFQVGARHALMDPGIDPKDAALLRAALAKITGLGLN